MNELEVINRTELRLDTSQLSGYEIQLVGECRDSLKEKYPKRACKKYYLNEIKYSMAEHLSSICRKFDVDGIVARTEDLKHYINIIEKLKLKNTI